VNGVSARRLGHVGTFFFGAAAAARLMGARGAEADGGGWRRKISKSPTLCKRTQMDVGGKKEEEEEEKKKICAKDPDKKDVKFVTITMWRLGQPHQSSMYGSVR